MQKNMKKLVWCDENVKLSELLILTLSQCSGDVFQSRLFFHLKKRNYWLHRLCSGKCFFSVHSTVVFS
jgi:hypothetical protein